MNLEEKLDEALKQTFPASDAFSLSPDPQFLRAPREEKTSNQYSESAPDSRD